jgi:hypothetical protein
MQASQLPNEGETGGFAKDREAPLDLNHVDKQVNPLQRSGRRLSDNRLSVSLFGEYLYIALSGKLVRRELRIVNHECPVQRYEGTN